MNHGSLIVAYHGCDVTVRDDLVSGRLEWGPLVFSAITGGTQTQHWRGGGVGRSLILLAFLFTFKSGIRGVKP